eukprot:366418-Chlamydomonas_euryale.AAC.4
MHFSARLVLGGVTLGWVKQGGCKAGGGAESRSELRGAKSHGQSHGEQKVKNRTHDLLVPAICPPNEENLPRYWQRGGPDDASEAQSVQCARKSVGECWSRPDDASEARSVQCARKSVGELGGLPPGQSGCVAVAVTRYCMRTSCGATNWSMHTSCGATSSWTWHCSAGMFARVGEYVPANVLASGRLGVKL